MRQVQEPRKMKVARKRQLNKAPTLGTLPKDSTETESGRGVSPLQQSRDGSATLGSLRFAPFAPFRGYFPFPERSLSRGLLMITPNGKIARIPAALRESFTHEGCHSPKNPELTRPPGLKIGLNQSPSASIGVNRSSKKKVSPPGTYDHHDNQFLGQARQVARLQASPCRWVGRGKLPPSRACSKTDVRPNYANCVHYGKNCCQAVVNCLLCAFTTPFLVCGGRLVSSPLKQ